MTDLKPTNQSASVSNSADEKESFYNVYAKELKYQEMLNYKNKFDNRLYYSRRYKDYSGTEYKEDELFNNHQNFKSIVVGLVYLLFILTTTTVHSKS